MVEAPAMNSFSIVSGTHVQFEFTMQDDDGVAVNLIGGSGRFAMARNANATGNLVIDSAASPETATLSIIDAAAGRLNVVITDENTDGLNGDYYYELQWTDSVGRSMPTARGWISVEPNLL